MIGLSVFPWLYTIIAEACSSVPRAISIHHSCQVSIHISLTQSCWKLIKILSLSSISENPTHLPQLPITFPVLCGRYNRGRAVAFHIYRFCRNRAIIHPVSKGLSLDTSRIVVVGVSGGNYPARAAATLNSIVPRPIGWLDLFRMGGDWLLDFWINGVDVERTMPLDITLHDMAKADELMKTGGGAVVSEVESVLVDGKATDELGRFNLWIAWQKRGIFLDYVLSEPGISARLAQVPHQSRLEMIRRRNDGYCSPSRQILLPLTCYMARKTFWCPSKRA